MGGNYWQGDSLIVNNKPAIYFDEQHWSFPDVAKKKIEINYAYGLKR